MAYKKIQINSEQTLHLEELRQALAKALPADVEVEAYPVSHLATCGPNCFIACDGTCWTRCDGTCWTRCVGSCWSTGS